MLRKGLLSGASRRPESFIGGLAIAAALLCVGLSAPALAETPETAAVTPAGDVDPASAEAGKTIYETIGCSTCHGVEGEGVVAPRLIGSRTAANKTTLIQRILYGGGDMPPFSDLSDTEIAAISNYVRTVINKQTQLVTPEEVAAAR